MRVVTKSAPTVTVTKSTITGLMTDVTPTQNKLFRFDGTQAYWKLVTNQGAKTFEGGKRQLFMPGQIYSQAQIDAAFPVATLTSITPNAGLAAGGLAVTIKGTNLGGVTALTMGGTTFTSIVIVDDNTITAVTPAKTAGAYNVVATDDSGATPTLTNGFTYS
jgi:phage/plasmid primase-like uncharacterized protein